MSVVGGGMSIIASALVVVDEGGGNGLSFVFSDVESGEARGKLILEMGFVLRREMVAGTNALEERTKDGDLLRVLSGTDGDVFVLVIAPVADFGLLDVGKDSILGLGEVDNPGMGGL